LDLLLQLYIAFVFRIPGWLQTPVWYRPLTRALGHVIRTHQGLGLFGVIFGEELGIPLPAPGDVVVAYAGYMTSIGAVPLWEAYAAVVAGSTIGATCLYLISRRFGHPFLLRYGRYVGFDQKKFERVERIFGRWGPWAVIVGRHIPGLRIYLSALSGIFEVRLRIFVPCVMISSSIWAFIFITIGRLLGRRTVLLFRLIPAHLLPYGIGLVVLTAAALIAIERGWHPFGGSKAKSADPPKTQPDFHKT
jgi:membrane protein DedA with SNARE-associated domain